MARRFATQQGKMVDISGDTLDWKQEFAALEKLAPAAARRQMRKAVVVYNNVMIKSLKRKYPSSNARTRTGFLRLAVKAKQKTYRQSNSVWGGVGVDTKWFPRQLHKRWTKFGIRPVWYLHLYDRTGAKRHKVGGAFHFAGSWHGFQGNTHPGMTKSQGFRVPPVRAMERTQKIKHRSAELMALKKMQIGIDREFAKLGLQPTNRKTIINVKGGP